MIKQKEVDIIFFIEHKDRELESIKLIAKELEEKGKKVLILSVYFHVYYLYLYKAKVFVFPYLINKNDWPVSIVYKMYGDNIKYINMNWEQLLFPINIEYKKPQDSFVKSIVSHISWSEDFKQYLINYGVEKNHISVTGNPANEVLYKLLNNQKTLRKTLSTKFNLDENKKWLFLPMNYAWAFSSDDLIKAKIKNGYPTDKAWKHREYARKCLEKFIYFVDDISKKYNYEIIIRPHPSITEDDYKKVFNQYLGYVPKNIILNKSYSIREWIISSDIIGSSWSTSVWDAYNIGKSVFLFTPYKRPEWLEVWWNSEVVNIDKFDESQLSNKMFDNNLQLNIIDNIAKYLLEIENNISIPQKKEQIIFDIKSNVKIFKSLLLNMKIIRSTHLQYDYFNL